ncbi:phospholipid carrier-dependent glycosyltransferase [Candidatus Bathyarchaeota archaeon]|nr:phospholipid carrier-dependent glycosyltransferase [Candidatus Bathyarchaeota archaeon]
MIPDLKITKKDIVTMVLLSVLFFSIAAYNLGEINYAQSYWENTSNSAFYVDLGSSQQVQKVYFFVRQGNATVQVSYGSPDNWNYMGQFNLESDERDFYKFYDLTLNINTQYLEFNVTAKEYDSRPQFYWVISNPTDKAPSPYVAVTEIGLTNSDNQQVVIQSITALNDSDTSISKLADEQGSMELPPTYMSKMYFDEIYFARAAIEFANDHVPVERTHPPLGKLIQAVGVMAFGESPFGWRIMGVLFASLMVPLMYLIGKKLFGTWIAGFSASFLFTFDFMHFTMARIGTVDTYMVFFTLLSQLLFLFYFSSVLKKGWKDTSVLPLVLSVAAFACAFATKFGFPLFSALGLLALLVMLRLRDVKNLKGSLSEKYVAFFDKPALLLIACMGLVAVIYFAAYIPEMALGNSPIQILDLQNAMFGFHSGGVSDSASSAWWSWPLMFSPDGHQVTRWFDVTWNLPNNTVSTISVFGNPAVWWVGFVTVIVLAIEGFHVEFALRNLWQRIKKVPERVSINAGGWDAAAIFIVVVFAFAWLPFVFIGRAAYIYHYYNAVPMLCLAITYFVNRYWSKPYGKVLAVVVFAAAVALFVMFYPVISGAPTTLEYAKTLKWFPSWYFAT